MTYGLEKMFALVKLVKLEQFGDKVRVCETWRKEMAKWCRANLILTSFLF